MTRYERTEFFEALVAMRARHATAGDADRRSVITVDDAILWAEAILEAYAAEDAKLVVPEPIPGD